MGYLSIRQTAEKWNLSARWISDLCKAGRIPGATKNRFILGGFQRMRKSQLTQEYKSGRYVKTKEN